MEEMVPSISLEGTKAATYIVKKKHEWLFRAVKNYKVVLLCGIIKRKQKLRC